MFRILFGLEDRIRLGLGDTPLPYDPSKLSAWEAAELESIGLGLRNLGEAVRSGSPRALLAVGWLAARRQGKAGRIEDFDFELTELALEKDPIAGEGLGKDEAAESPTPSPDTD